MNYLTIQLENKTWAHYNFGDHSWENPALGILEEIGETAHAILKARQKIRAVDDVKAAVADGCADCIIFLSDYCNCTGIHMVRLAQPDEETNIFKLLGCAARQASAILYDVAVQENVSYLISTLEAIGRVYDFNLEEVAMSTWNEVKARDWRRFPKNGVTE